MQKAKQFTGIVLGIAAVLALKFYNKAQTQDDLRKDLRGKCGADARCTAAVDQHFEGCFEKSYSMGGRSTSGLVKTDKFLTCFNEASGAEVFAVTAH